MLIIAQLAKWSCSSFYYLGGQALRFQDSCQVAFQDSQWHDRRDRGDRELILPQSGAQVLLAGVHNPLPQASEAGNLSRTTKKRTTLRMSVFLRLIWSLNENC